MTCKYWAQISKLRTKEEDSLPAEDCWSQNDEANNAWNFDYIYLFICVQVFVHFGASWCVPSLAMNSFFEELAMTYQDILYLVVDVDEVKVWFMTLVAMIPRKIISLSFPRNKYHINQKPCSASEVTKVHRSVGNCTVLKIIIIKLEVLSKTLDEMIVRWST